MKAIVVAGGDAAAEDAAQLSGAEMVIAADSGAAWLESLDRLPDLVIGDMDSIKTDLLDRLAAQGVAVEVHSAEKDASDVELAVAWAVGRGVNEIVIIGGFGGPRLDHELANLLLLADDRWERLDIQMVRGDTKARVIRGGGRRDLQGAAGDLVTLLPLGGDATGVVTAGLRYTLDEEILHRGRSRGLSNLIERAPASVSVEEGILLIIETRKEPRS